VFHPAQLKADGGLWERLAGLVLTSLRACLDALALPRLNSAKGRTALARRRRALEAVEKVVTAPKWDEMDQMALT
jgi:hypothetical protein